MKNFFKQVIALMCIMTLLTTPMTAYASTPISSLKNVPTASPTSTPVLSADGPGIRSYIYNPVYLLYAGQEMVLSDVAYSVSWVIPAGNYCTFKCLTPVGGLCKVSVVRLGYGIVYNDIVDTNDKLEFSFGLPAETQTYSYQIHITAISSNLEILYYSMSWAQQTAFNPVLVYSDDSLKWFELQPTYHFSPNDGAILPDTTNGKKWFVPAGHGFMPQLNLADYGSFIIRIYKLEPTMQLIYDQTFNDFEWFSYDMPPISSDANYLIVINAITDIDLVNYAGSIF